MTTKRTITLYCQDSGSDKVYQLLLNEVEGGYKVYYANARRGQALKPRELTPDPVSWEEANKLYDSKEKAKRKGKRGKSIYSDSVDGGDTLVINHDSGKQSGITVQLLNKIDEAQARALCHDDTWVAQEKHDGERRPLLIADNTAKGVNLYGEFTGGMKTTVSEGICTDTPMLLDTEDLDSKLMAFDILELDGVCLRNKGFLERANIAQAQCEQHDSIHFSPVAVTTAEKIALLERMIAENREGMVFKRANAPFTAGRPNKGGDQLKFKLYDEASVIVAAINQKRSFKMALLNEQGEQVLVGNCTIPANQTIPSVGDVVEVSYLYAYRGGSLYQPTFNKARPDQRIEECRQSQLKYKPDAA